MIAIYIDIDGTLNQPEESYFDFSRDYRPVEILGEHYFKNLPVQEPIGSVMHALLNNTFLGNRYEVYTISHIRAGDTAIAMEHMHDKIAWLQKHFPELKPDHCIWCLEQFPKSACVEIVQNKMLSESDILIDDYSKNLAEWNTAGGTAVKFLNGHNSENNTMYQIHKSQTKDEIINLLTDIWRKNL